MLFDLTPAAVEAQHAYSPIAHLNIPHPLLPPATLNHDATLKEECDRALHTIDLINDKNDGFFDELYGARFWT
jgi:hypothetical protein